MFKIKSFLSVVILFLAPQFVEAAPACHLRLCSQNMHNFGNLSDSIDRQGQLTSSQWLRQRASNLKRIVTNECDVIAAQEIINRDRFSAEQNLFNYVAALKLLTRKNYRYKFIPTNDLGIGLAVIYASDLVQLMETEDLSNLELPTWRSAERPILSNRGPLRAIFKVRCTPIIIVDLYNFHFKSKSTKGGFDPSGFGFELQRTIQAESLRHYASKQNAELTKHASYRNYPNLTVLLGDRNSDPSSVSSAVLTGALKLKDLQIGNCPISKTGFAYCNNIRPIPDFISIFGGLNFNYARRGTFKIGKKSLWLDDILLYTRSSWYSLVNSLQLKTGLVSAWDEASDHAMIYGDIAW